MPSTKSGAGRPTRVATAGFALVGAAIFALTLLAADDSAAWNRAKSKDSPDVCSQTARSGLAACNSDTRDNFFTTWGDCLNLTDEAERSACFADARDTKEEEKGDCRDQFEARVDLCNRLGEEAYDPSFDPADFDNDFSNLTNPNPYYPLGIGHVWNYEGGGETDVVEVRDATKLIEGVTCIVVHDVVSVDGQPTEDTDDWIAQGVDGTVHYCGESSRELETFEGDDPPEPELVATDGSFKVGREYAKPGILMPATPAPGQIYRQEYAFLEAEDVAKVVSTTYRYGDDPKLDFLVPQALAELLCGDGDCVVTREYTPLEPDVVERKYYANGIGVFLEVNLEEEGITQLVDCNFDARCDALPAPAPAN